MSGLDEEFKLLKQQMVAASVSKFVNTNFDPTADFKEW